MHKEHGLLLRVMLEMRTRLAWSFPRQAQRFPANEVLHRNQHGFRSARATEHDIGSHARSHARTSPGSRSPATRRARRAADWARSCRSWCRQMVEDQRRGYQLMRWNDFQHQAQCDLRKSAGQQYRVNSMRYRVNRIPTRAK